MSDITFDNPSYPIWKAGYDAGLATANERIRELEAERDRWYGKATERAITIAAERDVSDKLLIAATRARDEFDSDMAEEILSDAIAEVAAIRAKQAERKGGQTRANA